MNNLLVNSIFVFVILQCVKAGDLKTVYTVATVEYEPYRNSSYTSSELLQINLKEYIKILDNINQEIDVIVYPEATLAYVSGPGQSDLATELPYNEDEIICNSTDPKYAQFFKELACAAKRHNTYMVVNLVVKKRCTVKKDEGCNSDGFYFYNSNVVFGRNGQVLAYYFKFNLFDEPTMTVPEPRAVTFQTEMGEFGTFICFDILFSIPPLNLTKNLNIKNFVYSTMWFSELPFLTSLQTQQMWAHENDAVFIAAGANSPAVGSGGSGIFLGKQGPIDFIFSPVERTRVLIRTIDQTNDTTTPISQNIDELAKSMDSVKLLSDKFDNYTSKVLQANEHKVVEDVCQGETNKFCCTFKIDLTAEEISNTENYKKYVYHLVAFSGTRLFGKNRKGGVDVCGIIACQNESLASCGERFSNYSEIIWPVTFNYISIEANFTNSENRIQFPNSLLSSITPISPQYTTWTKNILDEEKIVQRVFTLNQPQDKLMTFAIYGRNFDLDNSI